MLEVGRITKPHGLRGEVVVAMVSNRPERLVPGSVLSTDAGELEVLAARPMRERWVVTFAGVGTRTEAEGLRGVVLRAPPLQDPGAWWVHELVGCEVFDTEGKRLGVVTAVVANPASDLLEIDDGGLVPLQFAQERSAGTEASPGRIVVDVPPGLLD
jgi:16S rRNA processing protein RimM